MESENAEEALEESYTSYLPSGAMVMRMRSYLGALVTPADRSLDRPGQMWDLSLGNGPMGGFTITERDPQRVRMPEGPDYT